jgi:hypothetical protein
MNTQLRRSPRLAKKASNANNFNTTDEFNIIMKKLDECASELIKQNDNMRNKRIQHLANWIIHMPKGIDPRLSKAEAIESALINYEKGNASPAETKLAELYHSKFSKTIKAKATYVDNINALAPCDDDNVVANILLEIKEQGFKESEPKESDEFYKSKPVEIRPGVYRAIISNDTIYEGEMKNDMFHGDGKFIFPITSPKEVRNPTYVGKFSNDLEHGKGRYDWGYEYDYYYEGDFVNGKFHGDGILVNGDNVQIGKFMCDKYQNEK